MLGGEHPGGRTPARRSEGLCLAAYRRFDLGDVDLLHQHHRLESALCHIAALGHCVSKDTRSDLPRQAPSVLAPAAHALLAAIVDNRVPVTVGFSLIVGGDLKGECLAVLERIPAIEAYTRHAAYRELDRQDIAHLTAWKVGRRTLHRADRTVGKGPGIKVRGFFRVIDVPQADCIFVHS
jgi:hypothetical protein